MSPYFYFLPTVVGAVFLYLSKETEKRGSFLVPKTKETITLENDPARFNALIKKHKTLAYFNIIIGLILGFYMLFTRGV